MKEPHAMETLLGVALLGAPFVLTGSLLALVNRRERRRQADVIQQIALTDAIHARLGASVAPVVRRRGKRWQVAIAVPLERPAVVATVLAVVEEVFARPEPAAYEVVLSRQSSVWGGTPPPGGAARCRSPRAVSLAGARPSRAA
jgi:hypothetical protein